MHRVMLAFLASAAIGTATAADVGGPAPEFTLPSRGGEEVSLADLRGQVVMINFWASWCAPCLKEMPHLEALYKRYGNLGFTLLGVNVEDNPRAAERWLAERPVSFPILFDRKNDVSTLYQVIAMPTTVLVDRQGNRRFIHHGYQPGYEDQYQTQIRALLRE